MINLKALGVLFLVWAGVLWDGYGQTPSTARLISPLTREYVYPTRIVWQQGQIQGSDFLLETGDGQANLTNDRITILRNSEEKGSIVLDFGREINGAVEIITGMWGDGNVPRNVRIRLGESVAEAMSDIGQDGATNDHAMRDFHMQLPWLGKN